MQPVPLESRPTACPSCGAAARPTAAWCSLCHAGLRPTVVAAPEVPARPALLKPGPAGFGPATGGLDPGAAAVDAGAAGFGPATGGLEEGADGDGRSWPCNRCGTANPMASGNCSACGSGFLAALRDEQPPLLVIPGVGDLTRLSRSSRLLLAVGLVLAVLLPLAVVTLLLTGRPSAGTSTNLPATKGPATGPGLASPMPTSPVTNGPATGPGLPAPVPTSPAADGQSPGSGASSAVGAPMPSP